MTNQFIVSCLLPEVVFEVSGYLVPRKITSKDGNELNLYRIRKKYLEDSEDNPNTKTLIEFLSTKYPEVNYIQEFPIPMKDFFLNYRCLDFFLPEYGVGIELDSHYHDDSKDDDTRSDLYIYQKYGVRVLRFRLASETTKEKDLKELDKFFHTHKPLGFNFPLEFSDIVASEFRKKYKEEIKELEDMENQFSCGVYSGNLIISGEQEKRLKPILRILGISYNVWN